jgi:hypothetical protein
MRKLFALATIAGIALAAPLVASAPAMADDQPLITVGEGACVAPWHWDGPLNILTHDTDYSACNGPAAWHPTGSIAGVLDDSCLLPWYWTGPGDVLTGFFDGPDAGKYKACDNTAPHMP